MDVSTLIALAGVIFGSTGFWTWLIQRNHKRTDQEKLLMGLAYDKIIWQCEKYLAQGHIPIEEYNELNRYMFEPYKNMGGNGTAAKLMDEVRKLPTKKEGVA